MKRQDAEQLAFQYARRRIMEGVPRSEATLKASLFYGLTGPARRRLIEQIKLADEHDRNTPEAA